ncbi:MAG: hypothetical protein ACKPKO_48240, partial [Candidatus Fonsibacter sp.]
MNQVEDEEAWTLTWGQKKVRYGKTGLIAVGWGGGGRGEVVDDGPDDVDGTMEDQTIAPSHIVPVRRTDDAKELAFFHALPSTLLDEVIHDYQLGAILDNAVGDG